jgi:hypothetical protein
VLYYNNFINVVQEINVGFCRLLVIAYVNDLKEKEKENGNFKYYPSLSEDPTLP